MAAAELASATLARPSRQKLVPDRVTGLLKSSVLTSINCHLSEATVNT